MDRIVGPGFHERVYEIVLGIPPGRVTTYGDIAGHLGSRRVARKVGHALAALPPDRDDVPWHRVVNARGMISRRAPSMLDGIDEQVQRVLLEREGIHFDISGRIELEAYRWRPRRGSRL